VTEKFLFMLINRREMIVSIFLATTLILRNNKTMREGPSTVRICLHIGVRFGVRFAAKGSLKLIFDLFLMLCVCYVYDMYVMCRLAIVKGIRKRSIFSLRTNCAQNRRAIRTQIRTCVDGP
jgi:hypothetical protein